MGKEETRLYSSVPNQGRDPVPEASIPKSCENGDAVKPLGDKARAGGLKPWSLPTAFADLDGSFSVVY